MKKMILSVALMIATFGFAQANNYDVKVQQYSVEHMKQGLELYENNNETADADSTQYITAYYGINRIVIKNIQNQEIQIYNSSWELIKETNKNVNMYLEPGDYYIKTQKRIRAQYIFNE